MMRKVRLQQIGRVTSQLHAHRLLPWHGLKHSRRHLRQRQPHCDVRKLRLVRVLGDDEGMLHLHRRAASEELQPHHILRQRLARRGLQQALASHDDEVPALILDLRRLALQLIALAPGLILHRQAGHTTRRDDARSDHHPPDQCALLGQFNLRRARVDENGLRLILHDNTRFHLRRQRHRKIVHATLRHEVQPHPLQRPIRHPFGKGFHLNCDRLSCRIDDADLRGLVDGSLWTRESAIHRESHVRRRRPVDLQRNAVLCLGTERGQQAKGNDDEAIQHLGHESKTLIQHWIIRPEHEHSACLIKHASGGGIVERQNGELLAF